MTPRRCTQLLVTIAILVLTSISGCAHNTAANLPAIGTVTLVNSFEIPRAQEDAFIAYWTNINDVLKREPGYVSSRLLRANGSTSLSTNGEAEFPLVAVITFESEPQFWAAVNKGWDQHGRPEFEGITNHPGLYEAIR